MNIHDIGSLPDDSLLLDHEAASIIRLSKSTLNSWRVAGKGPAYLKVGGRVRYRAGDLKAWLRSNLCAGGASRQ
ncbi:helix-turn-helix transcriptional regulator [Methylococcus capsulatus]|uniref:helix-turn-helix transcriptional regulator n=1 Tax=Methylococcus capsulatus TaxID=414 RepID=UPI001C52AD64|nr:helix-turn-helix domain-containing protein [Methylococcus capsulatus]